GAQEVAAALKEARVPAVPFETGDALPSDPHLAARRAFFSFELPRLPPSPLFPYTTLFRSFLFRQAQALDQFDIPQRLRGGTRQRSEEHTSELQSRGHLVCRLLLEKKTTQARASSSRCHKRKRLRI